MLSKMNEAVIF